MKDDLFKNKHLINFGIIQIILILIKYFNNIKYNNNNNNHSNKYKEIVHQRKFNINDLYDNI